MRIQGFTLIEFVIVIGIMLILAMIFSAGFTTFRNAESLQIGSRDAASFIDRARAQTIEGLAGSQYGVRIASTTLTLFVGSSYDGGSSSNVPFYLPVGLTVMSTTLSNGGVTIVFDKLTGATSESGTITLKMSNDLTRQKTIVISSLGVISVQ